MSQKCVSHGIKHCYPLLALAYFIQFAQYSNFNDVVKIHEFKFEMKFNVTVTTFKLNPGEMQANCKLHKEF